MIANLFLDPKLGFVGKAKLKKKLVAKGIRVSDKELDEFYKHAEHTQVKKRIVIKGYHKITAPAHWYQIDVIKMPPKLKSSNNGIHKFFVAIEIGSRKAFVYPLKSNKAEDIVAVYEQFVKDTEVVCVEGDAEFDAKAFQKFNEDRGIMVITDVAKDDHLTKYGDKLGIVDAFTKNLKGRIRDYMEANDTPRFIDVLDDIVANYNDTPHSSLEDHTPDDMYDYPGMRTKLRMADVQHNRELDRKIGLKVGDAVRVAVGKGIFDKEKATFSREIHPIEEKVGNRYRVGGKKKLYKYYELLPVDEAKVIKGAAKKLANLEAVKKAGKAQRKLQKEGLATEGVKRKPRKAGVPKKKAAALEQQTGLDLLD